MGNSLKQFAPGSEEKKAKEIDTVIEKYFRSLSNHPAGPEVDLAAFYRTICEAVQEINVKLGSTQFRVPQVKALQDAYHTHHQDEEKKPLTKDEFEKIFRQVIIGTGFTGIGGAKDTLLYIFGVPVTAFFIKQRVIPRAIPNEIFIPGITSATVFILAKLNKL